MRNLLLVVTVFIGTIPILTSCELNCVDKKTGMPRSSQTLKDAQARGLSKYEFTADNSSRQLESGLVFNIKNAWVENNWTYECVDNNAEVVRDSSYQFVIDADYKGDAINSNYWLENNHLGAVLSFDYTGQDTIFLALYKQTSKLLTQNKLTADTIIFVKQRVSR